jgi:hypothetical protein
LHPPLHIQNGCREDLFRQKTRLASQHRRLSFHPTENFKSDVDKNTLVLLVDHFCSTIDKLVVDSHDLFEFQQLRQFHHQRDVRHVFYYTMVQKLPVQEAVQTDCDAGEELGKSCFATKNRQLKINIETIKQNTFSSLFLLGGCYNIFINKLDSHNDGKSER